MLLFSAREYRERSRRWSLEEGAAPLILKSDMVTSPFIDIPLADNMSANCQQVCPGTSYRPSMSETYAPSPGFSPGTRE